MLFGYGRVSTEIQELGRQTQALSAYGVAEENLYTDKASGKNLERKGFKALLSQLRKNDTVVIESFSRLSRSTSDLLKLIEQLTEQSVEVISLKEKLDTSTPTGRLQLTMLSALVQYEREILLERQTEGIAIAKKNGATFGRPKADKPADFIKYYNLVQKGERTASEAFKTLQITKSKWYRLCKEHKEN